ncbi:MAG: amino acid adenylation domain-containing protein [Clostridia bacterium]|nr:amino acid adenylation domain-containing protein [Clostridia bacterium]
MRMIRNAFDYLLHTAQRLLDKTAFADENISVTFSELYRSALAVGSALLPFRKDRFSHVAVLAERNVLSLIGMFGAMAAGCTYVPLDGKMPAERLTRILEKVQPAVVLYTAKDEKTAQICRAFAPVLSLEETVTAAAEEDALRQIRDTVLDLDPAYMIFTSGSTGMPKGIAVSHRALIDFTECIVDFCDTAEEDVLGNQSPFYFDTSIKDVYQTLAVGCTCHILPKKLFMFPTLLLDALNEKGVTALFWSASAFRLLAESGIFEKKHLERARLVVTGGEALQAKNLTCWQKAHPGCRFMNHYGPTEVTVDCTMYEIRRSFAEGENIPIGRACRNMEILLLDENLCPVKDGEAGEICVRGSGLALGYYGEPDKTASAFIQNPLNPHYPELLYRTGDLAKAGGDGELIFLARRDDQIKHMGYRIELGEIETALAAVQGIRTAVCFFDAEADQIVCCAVLDADLAAVIGDLKKRLPVYMLPNKWRLSDSLPLNANGKIDRVRLKEQYFHEKA